MILYIWLVVWNMAVIFPNSWDDDPIWLSYFSEGLKPPISYLGRIAWDKKVTHTHILPRQVDRRAEIEATSFLGVLGKAKWRMMKQLAGSWRLSIVPTTWGYELLRPRGGIQRPPCVRGCDYPSYLRSLTHQTAWCSLPHHPIVGISWLKEAATPTRKWAQVTDNPALMSLRSIFLRPQETAASPDFCSQYKTKLDIVGLGGAGWAVAVGCQVGGDPPNKSEIHQPKNGFQISPEWGF